MRALLASLLLLLTPDVWGGQQYAGLLTPARDVSGFWKGTGPNNARFQDDVGNPLCRYEATLILNLQLQGNALNGNMELEITRSQRLLRGVDGLPCLVVGQRFNEGLHGVVSSSRIEFDVPGIALQFIGDFTTDIMSGDFHTVTQPGQTGIRGTWAVTRGETYEWQTTRPVSPVREEPREPPDHVERQRQLEPLPPPPPPAHLYP